MGLSLSLNILIQIFVVISLPIYLVYFLLRLVICFTTKKYKMTLNKEIINFFFIVYLTYLIYLVWLKPTGMFETLPINLIPFYTIASYFSAFYNNEISFGIILSNLIGNILLTVPMGLFISFYVNKSLKIKYILVIALVIPIVIELGQLLLYLFHFGTRSIDIDDVILNFIGILVGYFIASSFSRFFSKTELQNRNFHK